MTDSVTFQVVDPEDSRVQTCVQAYYDEISDIFGTRFDPVISGDPEADSMRPPRGVFVLAFLGDQPVGCCALKGQGDGLGEVKRLWVSPDARGLSLSKRLMTQIEDHARALGITRLQLDTNKKLTAARKLYEGAGWREIARYNDNPYAELFFEKALDPV